MSSWPFCQHCGSIFDLPDTDNIVCDCCNFSCKYEDFGMVEMITRSSAKPAPTWLNEVNKVGQKEQVKTERATVEEPCPQCGHQELSFYTMQLRSADEGQTVFYECLKCKHKFSVNN
mmetsp:Transcript_31177/g.41246  ORF Transcript_31177/g.41246 Transcript_31177/m.41246 type:complete len:117 (+) Transcript_31177:130-480(+)